ncbi:protein KTI12 [Nematocida major]|uniref:protein KTI12 n=1 Tax=Nematocida major TaxID=1912982 RepID=UPI002007FBE2|nr:protein KTI12 [Nematocida major]KAH9386305.1 protein KTI12 [Nematocida major]
MPLFMLSGLPSPQKKALFESLLAGVLGRYKQEETEESCAERAGVDSVLVVLQNSVGVSAKEETARLRSVIQNRLSKRVLVVIYAPLHIKGLRYEIASVAKNMGIDAAHIYCASAYGEGGDISAKSVEAVFGSACSACEIHVGGGAVEDFAVVSRVFEKPRKADKWDSPCFTADAGNIDVCAEVALEKVWSILHKTVKARTSSKRLVSSPMSTQYFQRVKECMDAVLEEKRKTADVPLKVARQSEEDFISSIKMSPPPVERVREIYAFFLDKYTQ